MSNSFNVKLIRAMVTILGNDIVVSNPLSDIYPVPFYLTV